MRSLQAKFLNQVDVMKIKITGKYSRLQISIRFDVFTLFMIVVYSKIHHPDWQRVWIIYCNSLFDRVVHSSLQSEIFYQVDQLTMLPLGYLFDSITIHNIQPSTDLSKIDLFAYKYLKISLLFMSTNNVVLGIWGR